MSLPEQYCDEVFVIKHFIIIIIIFLFKAIFGDDLKDLRGPSAWKLWKPLDILLTLYPQQGSSGNQEIHCTLGLHVMCPPEYPEMYILFFN